MAYTYKHTSDIWLATVLLVTALDRARDLKQIARRQQAHTFSLDRNAERLSKIKRGYKLDPTNSSWRSLSYLFPSLRYKAHRYFFALRVNLNFDRGKFVI